MVAIAYLIETCVANRVGICQAEGCGNLFVDGTKNRSKKYCSLTCLQRDKVRKYRTRQRAQLEQNRQHTLMTTSVFSYTIEEDVTTTHVTTTRLHS